jgi:hypothetical protein
MNSWIFTAEAEECRLLAVELAEQPEEPFLLCLASAFDDLHLERVAATPDLPEGEIDAASRRDSLDAL